MQKPKSTKTKKQINVVLVEPIYEENIGYAARLCENFSANLILVNPKANHLSDLAKSRAMHGIQKLKKAKICKNLKQAIKGSLSIAFSVRAKKDFSAFSSDLPEKISLVFGREPSGLTKEEIAQCDIEALLPLPSSYKSLSISHAIAISLFLSVQNKSKQSLSLKNAKNLVSFFNSQIEKAQKIKNKKFCQKTFQNLIYSSSLSEKELNALLSALKSLSKK